MAGTQRGPHSVFISYRRTDTAYPAGWLYDSLSERFGGDRVFKDVDSVSPGEDFIEKVTLAVTGCDVLLALIGKTWVTSTDADGVRRLEQPDDLVRLEIETALNLGIRVIPVLVDGAQMPKADDVPSSLGKLVRRQAVELAPHRFNADLDVILRTIAAPRSGAGATPPGGQRQAPPRPRPSSGDRWVPPPQPQRPQRSGTGGVSGALVGAMACAAIGAVLLLLGAGEPLLADGGDLFGGTTVQDMQRVVPPLLLFTCVFFLGRPSAAAGWLVGTGWAVVTLEFAATTTYAATRVAYQDAAFGTTSLTLRSLGAAFVLVATFAAPAAIDRARPGLAALAAVGLVGAGLLVPLGASGMRLEPMEGMPDWVDVATAAGPATLFVVGIGCIVAGLGSASAAAPVVTAAGVTGLCVYGLELWVRTDYGYDKSGDVALALLGCLAFLAIGAWQWLTPSHVRHPLAARSS
jgi:hypothetical protein